MPRGRMPEGCATTSCRKVAPRASRGKSWVLAMLAPKPGLRVAPVPPKAADLTRLARGRRDNGRSGRRNRRFDRTKEQPRVHRGLAVTNIRRLQSFAQWWVRLTKPHTQKFGHSRLCAFLRLFAFFASKYFLANTTETGCDAIPFIHRGPAGSHPTS
jgi:hypothetical protein